MFVRFHSFANPKLSFFRELAAAVDFSRGDQVQRSVRVPRLVAHHGLRHGLLEPAALHALVELPSPRRTQLEHSVDVERLLVLQHLEVRGCQRQARGADLPESFWHDPLMYQGGSDGFLGPRDAIPLADESWGCDLEGEVVVVTGDVPLGASRDEALAAGEDVAALLPDGVLEVITKRGLYKENR